MNGVVHLNNCRCGKTSILDKTDDWWVNAPNYYNCFWVYFQYNNRSHTLAEVGKLLMLSTSAINSIEKKAYSKIRRKIKILCIEKE